MPGLAGVELAAVEEEAYPPHRNREGAHWERMRRRIRAFRIAHKNLCSGLVWPHTANKKQPRSR